MSISIQRVAGETYCVSGACVRVCVCERAEREKAKASVFKWATGVKAHAMSNTRVNVCAGELCLCVHACARVQLPPPFMTQSDHFPSTSCH